MQHRLIRFAPRAETDLDEIEAYIRGQSGSLIATRVVSRILRRLDNLSLFPETGRVQQQFRGSPRMVVLRPWLILYEDNPAEDLLVIRRVLDGRRDVSRIVGEPG